MEVKEVIERLEDFISDFTAEGNNNMVEEFEQIISLLQQGEKYQQMWEELKDLMKKEVVNKYRCSCCDSLTCNWRYPMKDLEQKYFPKEASQDEE